MGDINDGEIIEPKQMQKRHQDIQENLHKIAEHSWGQYHPLHLPLQVKLWCRDYVI